MPPSREHEQSHLHGRARAKGERAQPLWILFDCLSPAQSSSETHRKDQTCNIGLWRGREPWLLIM